MKHSVRYLSSLTLISIITLFVPNYVIAQYCASGATTTFSAEIVQVMVTGQSMNISNSNSSGSCGSYMDNTYDTADVALGGTFVLSVTLSSCGAQFEKTGKVYIDWNGDLDFDDSGEYVTTLSLFANGVVPVPDVFNIIVPAYATPGFTRMRIVCVEANSASVINSCGLYLFGETEDYTLRINGNQNDVGIESLITPSFPACVMDSIVTVSIHNFGTDSLTSATINWSINSVVQTPYAYVPITALATFATDTLVMGTVTGGLNDGDSILIWASMANGISPDSNSYNDTLLKMVYHSLSGTYVIDPSGAGDFTSFSDAVSALDNFGVCSTTVIEAVDGTYNEQIELISFVGMDSVNTVTFRSFSGNPDSVILAYSSTGSADNYVIKMVDADNFMFEDMTIINVDTSYSYVFDMWGADNVSIDNCKMISSGTNYQSYNIRGYSYNQGAYAGCHNFSLTNSEIIGGYYGLYFYQYNDPAQNALIENNKFLNQYYRGVYLYYMNDLQFNNNYLNSSSTYADAYGFYFRNVVNGSISNNYIEGTSTWPRYGMYLSNCIGDLPTFMPVINNRISLPNSTATYGLYINNSLFVEYAYNSVYMDGFSSTRGMYITSGGYNKVKNNAVQVKGVNATAVYLNGSSIYQMDYNAFSSPNGSIGYYGSSQTTLGDWQTATGFDSNSIALIAMYSDTTTLKVCTDSLYGMGVSIPIYAEDFQDDLRQDPPCIGADEFMPISEFGFDNQTLCNGDTLILRQDYFDTVVWNTTDTSNLFMVTAMGPQSVAVYDACGSDTSNFNIIAPLIASINDTNLCEGTTTVLETGISNGVYLWSDGSIDSTLLVSSAQVAWVLVTDTFGCVSSDTAIITESANVNLPDSTTFCEGDSVALDAVISGVYSWNTTDTTQAIFVSSTGYYSVTVTDQNCMSSDSIYVGEILNPIASFSDSADHLSVVFTNTSQNADSFLWCFGDGTTSTVKHPTHLYAWSSSSPRDYIVSLIGSNVCASDSFTNTSVRVGNMGGGNLSSTSIIINKNNWTVSFVLGNAFSYKDHYWDFGDGSTSNQSNPTHTYASTNLYECYTVRLIYTDCVYLNFEKEIAVGDYPASNPCNIIDGIQNNQITASSIDMYPNPNNGVFNVIVKTTEATEMSVEVMDIRGSLVYTNSFGTVNGEVNRTINMEGAAPGIYFVKVILNGETGVYRLVVK